MERLEAIALVREVLATLPDYHCPVSLDAIEPAHHLQTDLGLDSVAFLDLGMALEGRLGRAVDEGRIAELGTLEGIASYLAEL